MHGHYRITGVLNTKTGLVLDVFCGCGGNSISFAKKIRNVISIDIDESKLNLLQHNSRVYDTCMNIECICADAYVFLRQNVNILKGRVDVILLAPPWGNDYVSSSNFYDIKNSFPCGDGFDLLSLAVEITPYVIYVLPRSINMSHISQMATKVCPHLQYAVENVHINSKLKMVLVFFSPVTH